MTQPEPSVRRRRRGFLAALLSLTVITLGAGAFSLAIFTDSAASTGSFATGTIDITSSPAVAFTVSNMMPGDANTQALTIANAGSATLRYAMVSAATNTLGTTLQLEVKTLGTNCATFDGTTVVGPTTLDGALIGSSASGAQAGDRVLTAATSEVLCFQVSLPLATGNALQNTTSAVTFTFDAEQTANNP
jgi:camelysin-like metallo-endopeptidase